MLSPERTVRAFASKLVVPLRSRHAQGRPDLQPLPAEGQADMLRALGDFLDEHDATYFAIATDHDVLKVSWQTPQLETEYRAYRPDQLDALRRRAREQRQHQGSKAPGANAELLRIIGQDLDRESVRLFGITRNVDGYRVSGLSGRTYVTKCYQTRELVTQSVARHRARGGASGMEPGRLEAAG